MKKILLLSLGIVLTTLAWSQTEPASGKKDKKAEKRDRINALLKMEEEGEMIFNKHNIFGIKLNTDGWGLSFEKGKFQTPRKTRLLQFEFNEKKHPKEDKDAGSIDLFTGNVNQFIFGKTNNFYQLKGGYGQQYLIGGKSNKNGVAVTAIWAGGVTLGFEKPYYVDVEDLVTQERTRVKFEDVEDLFQYQYLGASGFTVGWDEVELNPGAHLKTALRFDYGRFNESVAAIEAGLNVEFYSREVLQMIQNDPKRMFFNAYVTVLFGKRK